MRVGVPPRGVDHFQDRAAGAELAGALAAGESAVLVGAGSPAVVSGLGGVGKSQLAAHHAWRTWRDASVDVAVWVSASTRDGVVTAYAEAARKVLCGDDPGIADRVPEEAAQSLRSWLAATGRRWLVVLDDVRDPWDLRDLWPPGSSSGQVVVTTRRRDAVSACGRCRVVELGVFTEGEALGYLTRALPRRAVDTAGAEQVRGLAADLGFLPLALAQAAAFITHKPLLTVSGYRARLAGRRNSLADVVPPAAELPDEHQATVAATWSLSVECADRLPPEGLARPLLELASLLDPNGTPLVLFTSASVRRHLATTAGGEVGPSTVEDGLGCLHRLNLIDLDTTRPARTVTVHTLVQRAVRDTLTSGGLHRLAHVAADALLAIWPDIDTTDPDLAQALRSATDALHARTTPALWSPECHPLLFRSGRSLGETGQVTAVISHFDHLHRQARAHLGPDHPDTLVARHDLASWRGAGGDTTGAVADYEVLLADCLRVLGPDHPDTLATRNNLARWRGEAGDVAGAVSAFDVLLVDCLRVLGRDHPDTLATRNNLADLRGEAGDAAGAVAGFEALLADRLRVLGPDHPHTLTTRNNLAHWRGTAGDVVGAVSAFEALLADCRRVLGPDHPETLITRSNVARWRGAAGDVAGAVAEYEALLTEFLRVLGPDHPDTFTARNNLAHWRGTAGDAVGAASAFKALAADCERVLGPDHPHTVTTRDNRTHWQRKADGGAPTASGS
ncbi:hypothetical protein FHS29_000440 [Saccharothrix tamanrassetensis]|uniref:NB-ARC domain-containing protein n=1 Tax=Saccharothrix tamanrassetensis TaxID=1051531 RepID=A0A841CA74_9PSEU|nr:FxSxx-COOH system tetratricopeptide repeat protein [Saccharothrix tamanrassetensis]MBB5953870.1 hypothetical protein [Saccharothrix tamanrassetensis]